MAKRLKLRRADACATCAVQLTVGTEAYWYADAREVRCSKCGDAPDTEREAGASAPRSASSDVPDAGAAGTSAKREYDRRSAAERRRAEARVAEDQARRRKVKDEHPILGRLATAFTPEERIGPESQATKAWKTGAEGEVRVAEVLSSSSAMVINDRRIPGSRANIDHIAIGSNGVYVIDAKKYTGKIERRDKGGLFKVDDRLYVNGRDQTKLVDKLGPQCAAVRDALEGHGREIEIHPVLCFTGAEWSLLARPIKLRGATCLWPRALRKLVDSPGPLSRPEVEEVASILASALAPA